ncbi:MAG: hypothetical protein AUJ82_03015 [Verrucomicrobia bacterium CG1_02_43_26]|nr:MAG: hypothetical protein AUJ82_03015 [Verrucomicrobia bacterium CG1_02_43_26]
MNKTQSNTKTNHPFMFQGLPKSIANLFNGKALTDLTKSMQNSRVANAVKDIYNWSEAEGLNTGLRITTLSATAGGIAAVIGGLTIGPMGALVAGGATGAVVALACIGYKMATGENKYDELCRKNAPQENREETSTDSETGTQNSSVISDIFSSIYNFFTEDSVATQIRKGLTRAQNEGVNIDNIDFHKLHEEYDKRTDSSEKLEDFENLEDFVYRPNSSESLEDFVYNWVTEKANVAVI